MTTHTTRPQITRAFLAHEPAVRSLFAGFFSAPLIDRLCMHLFHGEQVASLPMIETRLQASLLVRVLRGEQVSYNGYRDPELADEVVRAREREVWL